MDILVGYSGFVGSNLYKQYNFDKVYNSQNIEQAFGLNPNLCVYSGVRAEMFLANTNPDADFQIILNAIENIKQINPKKLVLISTIAVYDNPIGADEDTIPNPSTAYGKNRYYLEQWVANNIKDHLIVRLPAIYGINLKKNFIYDMIHITPAMLKEEKFLELCQKDDFIKDYYTKIENGFYQCTDKKIVKPYFETIGFSALNFTDSRSVYQFYNLKHLWAQIEYAFVHNIKLLNLASEPISAGEVYEFIFGKPFVNEVSPKPFCYDMRTKYFEGGYLFDKGTVKADIKQFVEEMR